MANQRRVPGFKAWMAAYLDGDQHAFARLHHRLGPILRVRIAKLVADPAALDDVIQSAFLRAHEARGRFALEGSTDATVVAWYIAIARNSALDYVRQTSRRQHREAKAFRFDRQRWGGGYGDELNPEQRRIVDETRTESTRRVRAALDGLPARDRSIVVAHKVGGRTLADMARERGIPAVTMRVRAHRAYRRLLDSFQQQELGNSTRSVYDRARCDAGSPAAFMSSL